MVLRERRIDTLTGGETLRAQMRLEVLRIVDSGGRLCVDEQHLPEKRHFARRLALVESDEVLRRARPPPTRVARYRLIRP